MENVNQKNLNRAKGSVMLGRIFLILAFFSLIGAWITQLTGDSIFGMNQQHLFSDSIALSLIAVCLFLDAQVHLKNL